IECLGVTSLDKQSASIIVNPRFHDVILLEEPGRQLRRLIASHEDLERMFLHFSAHSVNLTLGNNVALIEKDYPVRHEIHLMKNVARDYEVHPLAGELLKETDRLGSSHRIQSIQWLVENHDLGIVGNRLSKTDSLPHALAVGGHLSVGSIKQVDALERAPGEPG